MTEEELQAARKRGEQAAQRSKEINGDINESDQRQYLLSLGQDCAS